MDVQWIVGCVAAHTVAPHPNFSQKQVQPFQLLALLAEGRFAEYERYADRVNESAPHELAVVRAVRDSLLMETQRNGAERLTQIARQSSASLPLRAAAGLFASVALSELDELTDLVDLLDDLVLAATEAGASLVEAALRQQLVLRLIEERRVEEARGHALRVTELDRTDSAEAFPTSKGYRGGARAALGEAHHTLRSHARAALATLESLDGKGWIEVVRSRPSLSDERASRAVGEAGTQLAAREFEAAISWSRGRRRFGASGDPVESPVVRALLHAELSGDVGNARARRELLGRLRLLDHRAQRHWAVGEGIRLLRQSDARESLDDAVQWIRSEGPLEPLANAASDLLERPQRRPTQCDLSVVAGASDLLEPAQLRTAIALCDEFRDAPSPGRLSSYRLVGWAAADLSWRWIARLLPASQADGAVVQRLVADLESPNTDLGALLGAFMGTVQSVDWALVDDAQVNRLRQWALNHEDPSALDLRLTVLDQIDGVRRHAGKSMRPSGLALAARLLSEHAGGVEVGRPELVEAGEACVADIERTMETAARGVYSFGGLSGAELAVLLAVVLGAEHLWESAFRFLRDDHVSSADKAPVLARLARLRDEPSASVASQLGDAADRLMSHQGLDPFEQSRMAVDPHGLRFLLAFQLLDSATALRSVSTLSGSRSAAERVEAARAVAVTSPSSAYGDWSSVVALQLSHDQDAVVRAEAGLSLSSFVDSDRRDVVRSRIGELMDADGVLVPLLALRGLLLNSPDEPLRPRVAALASQHRSRLVRSAAIQALEAASAD